MKKKLPLHVILCIAAVSAALAVGVFLICTLVLRTDFKNTALEINEPFRTLSSVTMIKGNEIFSVPTEQTEFFNMFLLDHNTAVFSKKAVPQTDETITLDFGKEQLSFTGLDDGSAIAIRWKTPEKEKNYIVRSAASFMQLNAYYRNCRRAAEET